MTVIVAPWFLFRLLARHGEVFGNLFPLHSASVIAAPDARSFFAFTVPLIRAIFYAAGAYISSLIVWGGVTRARA